METLIGKHWHHLPAEEVIDLLDGNPEGFISPVTIDEE